MADVKDVHDDPDRHGLVERERRHLHGVAYRLLGSMTEAEDAVQETYSRWYSLTAEEKRDIESPAAWLTTVASRICLDLLKSARAKRERYVGEWIPEPLPSFDPVHGTDWPGADPADRVTLDESVTMALLVVLEVMTPAERVTFILHDVFGYPFAHIGGIVGRTPAACRQLATSARLRIDGSRSISLSPSPPSQARLVTEFRRAWEARDLAALVALLDPDAALVADGGGLVNAARHPITGGPRLARYLTNLASRDEALEIQLAETDVNGRPGITGSMGGETVLVIAFGIDNDRIRNVWVVVNPDKLRLWNTS